MTPEYPGRMMAQTKTLQVILQALETEPDKYKKGIAEIKQILAERTLTALLTHGGTEE